MHFCYVFIIHFLLYILQKNLYLILSLYNECMKHVVPEWTLVVPIVRCILVVSSDKRLCRQGWCKGEICQWDLQFRLRFEKEQKEGRQRVKKGGKEQYVCCEENDVQAKRDGVCRKGWLISWLPIGHVRNMRMGRRSSIHVLLTCIYMYM